MTRDRTPQQELDRFRPASAWGPWFPSGGAAWDRAAAAHLLRRAGFGPAPGDLDRLVALGHRAALASVLEPDAAAVRRFDAEADALTDAARATGKFEPLAAAWVHRMLRSPDQLTEKLTLFWHGHFATSGAKVTDARLMADQIALLRRHARGRFGDLLTAVMTDPAMLLWLDADSNRAGSPNENFARELFELFALGPGNYSEADIKEAARALTGWAVTDAADGRRARFDPKRHDAGEKTVFGETGRFGVGEVVRLTLSHPACATFIVRKLFRFFVSETAEPSEALLEPLAEGFRLRNYDVSWVVGELLGSWVFRSPAAVRQRVKSPAEFCVGLARGLGGAVGTKHVAAAMSRMGQRLYFPPDVSGWAGGPAWLTSAALIDRQNLAADATSGGGNAARLDPATLAEANGVTGPAETARFFLSHFLQDPAHPAAGPLTEELAALEAAAGPFEPPRLVAAKLARRAAETAARLPEYQLA